jgi:hypothetical protein
MNTLGTNLRDTASGARERMNRSIRRTRDRVEVQIHRHPAESILVVAASGILVGFGVGFLAGRRFAGRNEAGTSGRGRR